MKKILLIFAILSTIVISCSKDDDSVIQDQLKGIWEFHPEYTQSPTDMPKYLTFGSTICYESDNSGKPTGAQQNYTVEFNYEQKCWVMILGERKFDVYISNNTLGLSYVVKPPTLTEPEKRISYPYERVERVK